MSREEIAKIVDRFLIGREGAQGATGGAVAMRPTDSPAPVQTGVDIEPHRVSPSGGAAPQAAAAPTAQADSGNGPQAAPPQYGAPPAPTQRPTPPPAENGGQQPAAATTNGKRAVDFVCEDDVRRAIQKGEKIYVGARTIITPAARDMGEASEVFAKA